MADETAARVAALAAWRTGRAESGRERQALSNGRSTSRLRRREVLKPGVRIGLDALLRELLDLATNPPSGGRPRRVRPPGRDRRRLPAREPPGPDRVLRRRDRLAPPLRPDRPADRRAGAAASSSRPVSSCPFRGRRYPHASAAGRTATERLVADLARFAGDPPAARASPATAATAARRPPPGPRSPPGPRRRRRRRGVGWCRLPEHRPRPRRAGHALVLDEPGDLAGRRASCGARPTSAGPGSSPRSSCRRTGETYLPPRDWKARLLAARTLELTTGIGGGRGDRRGWPELRATCSGWREPSLPPACAPAGWSTLPWRLGRRRPRIILASDQAARLSGSR